MNDSSYRHTQTGWVILGTTGVVLVILLGALVASGFGSIAAVSAALLASTMLLFGWLTVEVDGADLRARFGIGLIGKRIALSDVRAYACVKNPWYWGWGIRLYPGGWLYNVSGPDAVELVLRDGKRYRIGTDEPEALRAAIRAAVGELEPLSPGEAARLRTPSKLVFAAIAAALVFAIGGAIVAGMFAQAGSPKVTLTDTAVSVKSGFYGADFNLKDVTEVRLDASMPRVLRRTNGYAGGGSLRGHFDLDTLGSGQLFIEKGHPPFVFVRSGTQFFYVNYADPARTEELHRNLLAAWSKANGR
jgi:hypothetical protein